MMDYHQLNDALPKMPVATIILSTLPLPRTLHEHEAPALSDIFTIDTRKHAFRFNEWCYACCVFAFDQLRL